jgi:hypothetical protein
MVVFALAAILGVQTIAFACFTKVFAIAEGLLPDDERFSKVFRYLNLERGLVVGLAIGLLSIIIPPTGWTSVLTAESFCGQSAWKHMAARKSPRLCTAFVQWRLQRDDVRAACAPRWAKE